MSNLDTHHLPHLVLTEIKMKFFDWTYPTKNYVNTYIWWYKNININLFSQLFFEKTHTSVILYFKIDNFCPLKSNFHPFLDIWPNVWVWTLEFTITQLLSFVGTSKTCKKPFLSFLTPIRVIEYWFLA